MAIVKYHEKNVSIFAKIEGTSNVYNAPSATDAIPPISVDGSKTVETDSYSFLGDSLSRDEYTYVKDTFADVNLETPQQVLGALDPAITVDTAPLSAPMQACGAFIEINAAGEVTYHNNEISNDTISIDYRLSSADDLVNQKLYAFYGCRGTVDVSADLGTLPMLKFNFKGNAEDPEQSPIVNPNYGSQIENACSSIKRTTIVSAQIAQLDGTFSAQTAPTSIAISNTKVTATHVGHGLGTAGSIRAVKVAADGAPTNLNLIGTHLVTIIDADTYVFYTQRQATTSLTALEFTKGPAPENFCFSTLSASNFFGFDYQRYQTGCEDGFSKGAIPTDVTMSLLEDKVGGDSFNPDAYITNYFGLSIKFGIAAGKYVTYKWSKLQIANVTQGKVATYFGRDVTFRNTGRSFIVLQ